MRWKNGLEIKTSFLSYFTNSEISDDELAMLRQTGSFMYFADALHLASRHIINDSMKFISYENQLNAFPNDKFLDWSNLKAFADDKMKVAEKLKFVLGGGENIVGKVENAGYQHFLLFPQCFQNASFLGSLKVGTVL